MRQVGYLQRYKLLYEIPRISDNKVTNVHPLFLYNNSVCYHLFRGCGTWSCAPKEDGNYSWPSNVCANWQVLIFIIYFWRILIESLRRSDPTSRGVPPSVCVTVFWCNNNPAHLQWVGRGYQTNRKNFYSRLHIEYYSNKNFHRNISSFTFSFICLKYSFVFRERHRNI